MSTSAILDQWARPCVSPQGLYRTPSSNPGATAMKPVIRKRTYENVTARQRRDLINWCSGIESQIQNISAALEFKTDFACSDGCFVEYKGANKPWGLRMERLLNETYYANCNLAGPNHDFHTTLAEISIALETHGQVGWVFDNPTGKIKLIPATSIGNGMSPDSKSGAVYELGAADGSWSYWGLACGSGQYVNSALITKGQFAGNYLIDGIIVNRALQTVGYRLLGFDEGGNPSYADLSTSQMGLIFEPKFTDQIMGYPGLSDLVEAVGTVDDWNYYIGQAMKLSASLAVTRKSKDGNPKRSGRAMLDPNEPGTAVADRVPVRAFEIMQGGLIELATENDEEIGNVPFNRPSMNEEAFIERIETGFFAKHWPREFIYTKGFGRASARIGVVQARQKVWKRHRTLCRFGVQWLRRKIAHAMQTGELPENTALFDPYAIGLSTPAEISVDEGNDLKGDLSMLGRGVTSGKVICAKYGHNEEKIDEDNFSTLSRRLKRAKAIHASADNTNDEGEPILTIKEILQRIDNGGNPNQQMDLADPEDKAETAAEKENEGEAVPINRPPANPERNGNGRG